VKQPDYPPVPDFNLIGTDAYTAQLVVVRDAVEQFWAYDIRRYLRMEYRVTLYQCVLIVWVAWLVWSGSGFDEGWSIANTCVVTFCVPWIQASKRIRRRAFYQRLPRWAAHLDYWEGAVAEHRTEMMRRKWRQS
jgi:hypothetical protein